MTPNYTSDPRLLRLSPEDNVLIALASLDAGTVLQIGGQPARLARSVPFGHKVAGCDLAAGDKVLKYGVPIGSATQPIARGEHVHTHNLKSDYLPTYLHDNQERYFQRDPQ